MTNVLIFEKMGLNESPNLSMEQITRSLFNNEFLSDIQFKFPSNIIYAHTWELKKRSVVFQHQFHNGVSGVISVADSTYPVFFEFIQFIYTDECDVNEFNRIGLLKLATQYKVIRLETKLINGLSNCHLDIFQFCILEKYELLYSMMREWIEHEIHTIASSAKMETLHPDVLEAILKLDFLQEFDEMKLYELLLRWINFQSEQQKIPLAQRRERFDKLFRLIRFPTMSIETFTDCVNKNIDLFSKQDIIGIFRQISMGDKCTEKLYNATPRLSNIDPYRVINIVTHWETKFTVLNNIIMRGVRFGFCPFRSNIRISIIGKDVKSNNSQTLIFCFDKSLCSDSEMVMNLGEAIELKPNYEYTVQIEAENGVKVPILRDDRRPKIQDVTLNLAQTQGVRKLKESPNLLEIIFKVHDEKKLP